MSTWRTRQRLRLLRNAAFCILTCVALACGGMLAVECAMMKRAATPFAPNDEQQAESENKPNLWISGTDGDQSQTASAEGATERGADSDAGASGGSTASSTSFPLVNWSYWLEINPNILGWVSIPGTSVSYPIAQPPALEPTYYLDHDVYGKINRYGCIYLDDECREDGLLNGKNTVILGHHMSNGTMFAELASYADESFAQAHSTILLQTPQRQLTLQVVAVDVVAGNEAVKQVTFLNDTDFERWWKANVADSEAPEHVWTFCTCSYFFGDDERTLVYAVEKATL